ncbi:hypothetical protein DNTS_004791 [Danionella cerebrum]|uniref:C2H2-type domain-containing protein n=1 Tax=Danionella cerebrum TaxID=2873325 RepID=A0A553RE18_9TELE|nr:hypothetical protein DNTS_004791 [Danionella translucida]
MEVDLTTSDDPLECQDQNQNDDGTLDHTLSFEFEHHLEETEFSSEHCDESSFEDSVTENLQTDGKSSRRSSFKIKKGAIFSGKILSFRCSECKDDTTYSPNDLLKHFQGEHLGILPTYPCDLCLFVTNEFSCLQRHRIEHRNTLVTCEICNDGEQYSLLLLTRHFTNCHSNNGQFECKKCEFSTRDAGTFVQHIHRHNEHKWVKCSYGSPTQEELPSNNTGNSGSLPFSCPFCGYTAARRELLNRHLAAAHSEESNKWRSNEDNSGIGLPGLKLLLKKNPPVGGSREPQWISKLNSLAGVAVVDHNGKLFNHEMDLEDSHQFTDRTVADKKENNKRKKVPLKSEQQTFHRIPTATTQPKLQEDEISSGAPSSCNKNGLTVLMVKNKISIPPNCTTKVMGFKIKDGKKLLVLKVIPTKQADSSDYEVLDSHTDEDKTTSSSCLSLSPSMGSLLSLDSGESNEALLIKGQIEEVENHIHQSEEHKFSEEDATEGMQGFKDNTKVTTGTVLSSETKDLSSSRSHQSNGRAQSEKGVSDFTHEADKPSGSEIPATTTTYCNSGRELCKLLSKRPVDLKPPNLKGKMFSKNLNSEMEDKQEPKTSSLCEMSDITIDNNESSVSSKTEDKLTEMNAEHESSKNASKECKDPIAEAESNFLNSPIQEVFSFHNYSKDTSGSSPESILPEEESTRELGEEECEEDFGDWSLTLPASPSLPSEEESKEEVNESNLTPESGEKPLERVSDSDIEVDECIATVDDSFISMLPEKEECDCLMSENKPEGTTNAPENLSSNIRSAAVLGKILEKHSDAIISQQLEKERMRSTSAVQESARPTKTTLRILQTPEGKQQMYLQTKDKPYAVPVQLQSGAGFKLITKSRSPQINVSYVKPGIEAVCKTKGVALTLNGGRIGLSAQTTGQTAVPTAQSGSGNRYFVNASALKASLLIPGSVKSPTGEQVTNIPQTCYLLQRPLPDGSDTTGANSKTVLSTRPVLAMPVNSSDKTSPLQGGRQAYLVRYISPAKSGILLNSSCGKSSNQGAQGNEAGKNRVFVKILRSPNGTRFLSSTPQNTAKKPIYLATSSFQSPCSSTSINKSLEVLSTGVKTSNNSQVLLQKYTPVSKFKQISPQSKSQVKGLPDYTATKQKSPLISASIRPHIQRKRRRRDLFEEFQESSFKLRRILNKSPPEKATTSIWEPLAKDVERMLRLCPFSPLQEIKCPRRNQPVVVLNHPDADVPEVAGIMRSVNKYKGDVLKVALSQSTVKALLESPSKLSLHNTSNALGRSRPVVGNVRERFILKLKLKKTNRNKYKVVRSSTTALEQHSKFHCWFCGRVFSNQEAWIGHGQRHLMEATRDWNKFY